MSSPSDPLRAVVLISGGGTTLRNLLEKKQAGELPVEIVHVISSSLKANGLKYADDAGISRDVIERKASGSEAEFSRRIFHACREHHGDLAIMGGFLKKVEIPADFENRVMNIHPALIPMFCGKGYYGLRVHQAALEYGVKVSGCTVHFVDNEYDHGPIIVQQTVPVLDDDTPESLARRVFEAECEAYPEAIRLFADGRLQVVGRHVQVLPGK